MLQDRRPGAAYAASAADAHHGLLGDAPTVNGGTDPHLDVATRAYRFRILNASNARTYRLGFNDAAGRPTFNSPVRIGLCPVMNAARPAVQDCWP